MRKILLFICFIIVAFSSKSQTIDGRTYTPFNNYYRWKGGIFDSTLLIPDGIPTTGRRPGAIRYNAADSSIYLWTGTQWKKAEPNISGKVNFSDTAAMLSPYLRKIDTASLSNRVNLKVNISDTSNMLSPYLKEVDTLSLSNRINSKQNLISLTTTGTSGNATFNQSSGALNIPNYSTDTSSLSNRINERVKYTDTASMLSPYLLSNVAAATYATIAQNNAKVNISDTSAMLSPYLLSNVAAATYQLILDTVPLAVFGAGSGAAGDTLAFSTSAVYGSFYNAGSDTLIITQMRAGVLGTSPNITTEVYWNDSLNITAGATILVSGGTSVTGTIGATNVTSFTNNKIPPNVWVFVRTSAVATKPTYFTLTLLGYKKRI